MDTMPMTHNAYVQLAISTRHRPELAKRVRQGRTRPTPAPQHARPVLPSARPLRAALPQKIASAGLGTRGRIRASHARAAHTRPAPAPQHARPVLHLARPLREALPQKIVSAGLGTRGRIHASHARAAHTRPAPAPQHARYVLHLACPRLATAATMSQTAPANLATISTRHQQLANRVRQGRTRPTRAPQHVRHALHRKRPSRPATANKIARARQGTMTTMPMGQRNAKLARTEPTTWSWAPQHARHAQQIRHPIHHTRPVRVLRARSQNLSTPLLNAMSTPLFTTTTT